MLSQETWNTRIYEFEPDLPGAVSIRPLYGNGWRVNGLVRLERGVWELSGRYRYQRDRRRRHYGGIQVDLRFGE